MSTIQILSSVKSSQTITFVLIPGSYMSLTVDNAYRINGHNSFTANFDLTDEEYIEVHILVDALQHNSGTGVNKLQGMRIGGSALNTHLNYIHNYNSVANNPNYTEEDFGDGFIIRNNDIQVPSYMFKDLQYFTSDRGSIHIVNGGLAWVPNNADEDVVEETPDLEQGEEVVEETPEPEHGEDVVEETPGPEQGEEVVEDLIPYNTIHYYFEEERTNSDAETTTEGDAEEPTAVDVANSPTPQSKSYSNIVFIAPVVVIFILAFIYLFYKD